MYVDYEYYKSLYGEKAIPEADFNRLSWDADRAMDKATSGVDNVKKLQIAYPTDEYDSESVKRCACALIDLLNQIEQAELNASKAQGYAERADGTLQGRVITSMSAGNESISFATATSQSQTIISSAIKSEKDKQLVVYDFIKSRLSGICDANGVNLLYAGAYPYRGV